MDAHDPPPPDAFPQIMGSQWAETSSEVINQLRRACLLRQKVRITRCGRHQEKVYSTGFIGRVCVTVGAEVVDCFYILLRYRNSKWGDYLEYIVQVDFLDE